jgi:TRAP-type C4-dicarboxylate transport system permease small subunit
MQNTVNNQLKVVKTSSRLIRLGHLGYESIRQASLKFSIFAQIALAGMMFLTAADVILRYIFDSPIPGAYELTEYAMAIFVGTGIAYCGIKNAHVDVDLFVSRLSKRTHANFGSFTGLLSLGIFSLITWNTFILMKNVRSLETTSPALGIPVYPFIILVGVGCGLLTLVILTGFIDSIYKAVKK